MKVNLNCDWCGKEIAKYQSAVGKHNFCSTECSSKYKTKKLNPSGYTRHEHLKQYNLDHNGERMTSEVREKLSNARYGTGSVTGYRKRNGRHEHRTVAESILGRKLLPGEIVHHMDRNKQNNDPTNLVIMTQSEHARLHMKEMADAKRKRGDAR